MPAPHLACPQITLCLKLALCVSLGGRPYHRAGELLAVAHMRLAVQPDLGQLGDVLEAESVKLKRCTVCFPILVDDNGEVWGTPVLYVEKCQILTCELCPQVTVWWRHFPSFGPLPTFVCLGNSRAAPQAPQHLPLGDQRPVHLVEVLWGGCCPAVVENNFEPGEAKASNQRTASRLPIYCHPFLHIPVT